MPAQLQLSPHEARPSLVVPLDYIAAVAKAAGWPRAAAARFLFSAGSPAEHLDALSAPTKELADMAGELAAAAFGVAPLLPQSVLAAKSERAATAAKSGRP